MHKFFCIVLFILYFIIREAYWFHSVSSKLLHFYHPCKNHLCEDVRSDTRFLSGCFSSTFTNSY